MGDPLMLALDTSTRVASVALARPDLLLAEYTWQAGQRHTQQLLPVVRAILAESKAEITEVTALAVARGPGSFNGLRVGMATAKGFAFSLGVPLVAVGTLEIEAYPHAAAPWPICAIHDAGRGELAWAVFWRQPVSGWRQMLPERITKPEELGKAIRRRTLLCGEIPAWALPALEQSLGARGVRASAAASLRRASFLAELAWQRLAAGRTEDLATLQPLYLRRPPVNL